MSNTSPMRVGIAGAGFISDYHIQGLQRAGAEVVCVGSRTIEKARAKAEQFGITEATADVEGMLNRNDLDLMVIATPDATHEALAMVAIEAGRPLLLQKPMARTADSAERIRQAAVSRGVPLMVSFMHRYFEEVVALRELLADRRLGHVLSIRQRNATPGADWAGWFYDAEQSGGVVAQLGVHGIDLLRYVFGEIDAVQAVTASTERVRELTDGTIVPAQTEDTAMAIYRFANGTIASHEMSYREVAGTDRFRMEVYGDRGTAWLRSEKGAFAACLDDRENKGWSVPSLADPGYGVRHHAHILAMVRGTEPLDDSAADGVRSLRIVEAIEASARCASWTEVAQ